MELFESIMELRKRSQAPHYAVFDFDGSLIHNDCAEATLAYMARHDFPNARKDFEDYYSLLDSGNMRLAYQFGAKTLKGLSPRGIEEIVHKAMIDEGTELTTTKFLGRTITKGIAPRKNVEILFRRLQACGIKMCIVSASPTPIVRSTMKYFAMEADEVIGIQNVVENGCLTDNLWEPLSIYEGKVDCIKQYIHPYALPLLAVGDSMNDYPMLEYSRIRAVVDRGNALAAKARANNWFIL
jgi:HAD superfamily phosphoserine phosphatase-like hydrolase